MCTCVVCWGYYMHMHMYVYLNVKARFDFAFLSQYLSTLCYGSVNLELTDLTRQVGEQVPSIPLSLSDKFRFRGVYYPSQIFKYVLEI